MKEEVIERLTSQSSPSFEVYASFDGASVEDELVVWHLGAEEHWKRQSECDAALE